MNAAQVRAKARMAMKRREELVEAEETEGGEINLIPYLDIVTNLMLFLLASITAGFIIGQLNTTLPDHVAASASTDQKPDEKPDDQPLQLVVSVTKDDMVLWSLSGLEGSIQEPRVRVARKAATDGGAPAYDYPKLNEALFEIASTRWGGKTRKKETYEVILQADGDIPYETVIAVMDNLRRRIPDDGAALPPLVFPGKDDKFDPAKHPLFPDVLFSIGFE